MDDIIIHYIVIEPLSWALTDKNNPVNAWIHHLLYI